MRRLQSLGLADFEGGPEDNGVYHVQHAVVCALFQAFNCEATAYLFAFPDAHCAL